MAKFKLLVLVLFPFFLQACATRPQVKDVVADKMGYLDRKFSFTSMTEYQRKAYLAAFPNAPAMGFKKMVITYERTAKSSSGTLTAKVVQTVFGGENGLARMLFEISNNDVPFDLQYMLSYRGLFSPRSQTVWLKNHAADTMIEVKKYESTQKDLGNPAPNSEYVFRYQLAPEIQIVNFKTSELKCKTENFTPASALHPKLEGQAIALNCESLFESVLQGRSKNLLLQKYGFAVILDYQSSTLKVQNKVVSVEVE